MSGASFVLLCALELLGRSPESLPPIKLVDRPIHAASTNVEAYVVVGSPTIYVVTSTESFRDADCDDRRSLLKLASIIAHEEWHVRRGGDEKGAYEAQLMTLMTLGAGPESAVYHSVRRAMTYVLSSRGRAAMQGVAAAATTAAATATPFRQPPQQQQPSGR